MTTRNKQVRGRTGAGRGCELRGGRGCGAGARRPARGIADGGGGDTGGGGCAPWAAAGARGDPSAAPMTGLDSRWRESKCFTTQVSERRPRKQSLERKHEETTPLIDRHPHATAAHLICSWMRQHLGLGCSESGQPRWAQCALQSVNDSSGWRGGFHLQTAWRGPAGMARRSAGGIRAADSRCALRRKSGAGCKGGGAGSVCATRALPHSAVNNGTADFAHTSVLTRKPSAWFSHRTNHVPGAEKRLAEWEVPATNTAGREAVCATGMWMRDSVH